MIKKLELITMNKITLLLISIVFLSCKKTSDIEKQTVNKQIDTLTVNKVILNTVTDSNSKKWYDAIIVDYIKKSENELIKSSFKSKEQIEWLLDRTEKTDSTNYYIFNIGQEVSEEDGSESRFSSSGWIYIDSISKKIYEYDLSNETLILWKYNN